MLLSSAAMAMLSALAVLALTIMAFLHVFVVECPRMLRRIKWLALAGCLVLTGVAWGQWVPYELNQPVLMALAAILGLGAATGTAAMSMLLLEAKP